MPTATLADSASRRLPADVKDRRQVGAFLTIGDVAARALGDQRSSSRREADSKLLSDPPQIARLLAT